MPGAALSDPPVCRRPMVAFLLLQRYWQSGLPPAASSNSPSAHLETGS
jgi:hypothetical protein